MKRILSALFLLASLTSFGQSYQQQINERVRTSTFNQTVQNLNDLIAQRLTSAQANQLYKSFNYVPTWTEILLKPSSFTPSAHTHSWVDLVLDANHRLVTDLQIAQWNSQAGAGFSGRYEDLLNRPNIPVVPGAVSAFTNDANYTTLAGSQIVFDSRYRLKSVQINYLTDISNLPTLVTNTNQLTNGAGFQTAADLTNGLATKQNLLGFTPYNATNPAGYQTATDLSNGLATKQNTLGFTPYNATNPAGYQTATDLTNGLATKQNVLGFTPYNATNPAGYQTATDLTNGLNTKQNLLVSGTNIKTINGIPVVGSGDIVISSGTSTPATTNASSLTAGTLDDARLRTVATAGTSGGNGQIIESIQRDIQGRLIGVTTIATPTGGGTSTPVYSNTATTVAELQRVLNATTNGSRVNLMPGDYQFGETTLNWNPGGKTDITIYGGNSVNFLFGSQGRFMIGGSSTRLTIDGIFFNCTANTGNSIAKREGLLEFNERGSHVDPLVWRCYFTAPNCLRNGIAANTYSATNDGGDGTISYITRARIKACSFVALGGMGGEYLNHTWSDNRTDVTINGFEVEGCYFLDLGRYNDSNGTTNGMAFSLSGRATDFRFINCYVMDANMYGLEIVGTSGAVVVGCTFNYTNKSYIPISLADGYGNGSDATRDISITNCYMRSKTRPFNARGTTGVNLANCTLIGTTNEESGSSNAYFQKCTGVRLTGGSVVTGSFNPLRFDDCKEVVINVPSVTGSSTTTNYALISIYSGSGYTGAGSSDYRISINGSIYKKSSTTAQGAGKGTAAGIQTAAGDIYELQGTVPRVTTF